MMRGSNLSQRLAHWMGPSLMVVLVLAWIAALVQSRLEDLALAREQTQGLERLPPVPEPRVRVGIDGRRLEQQLGVNRRQAVNPAVGEAAVRRSSSSSGEP